MSKLHNLRECTKCKMLLASDEFGKPKLNGKGLRTCLKCRLKNKQSKEKNKCPHNKQRYDCRKCLGNKFCKHNRHRTTCKECDGGSICEHNRRRSRCKDCNGGSVCHMVVNEVLQRFVVEVLFVNMIVFEVDVKNVAEEPFVNMIV